MASDITNVITIRLKVMGMSQAQFAECISATPAQVSIFIRKQGSLSVEAIDKSFDLVGINISMYSKRIELSKRVAMTLKSNGVSCIDSWTQNDLGNFTQIKEIKLFHEVTNMDKYLSMMSSGLIDYESTFPYFKSLVSYFLKIEDSMLAASNAKNALHKLMNDNKTNALLQKGHRRQRP